MEVHPNEAIRDYIQNGGASTWEDKQKAATLYEYTKVISYYFFSPRTPDDIALPTPVIAIAPHDRRVLGWFKLRENAIGLPFEIGLNQVWVDRPERELVETICHELVHLHDQEVLGYKAKTGYHRKEFVEVAEEIGLHPKLNEGWHLRPATGQLANLMDRLGLPEAPSVKDLPTGSDGGIILPPGTRNWFDFDRGKATGGKIKGSSPLKLYTAADCIRNPICKMRSGRGDMHIGCLVEGCKGVFKPQS